MKTSAEGRALIEAFEGLDLHAYRDSVGVLTIGYGHTTAAGGPPVTEGMTITKEQADKMLSDDLVRVENNVAACIDIAMQQYEFDALVSFDFNTGCLRKGSVDDKINVGDKTAAMQTLLQYDHAGQPPKQLSGLTRRRLAERLMFNGDVQSALKLAGAHVTLQTSQPPLPKAERKPAPVPEAPKSWIATLIDLLLGLFRKGK